MLAAVSAPLHYALLDYALLDVGRPLAGEDADRAAPAAFAAARAGVWAAQA